MLGKLLLGMHALAFYLFILRFVIHSSFKKMLLKLIACFVCCYIYGIIEAPPQHL